MQTVILVDLDGTISNCEWRLPMIQTKPKNWPLFFAGIVQDKIIVETADFVKKHVADGAELIFFTARPSNTNHLTHTWLQRHGYKDYKLITRQKGDFRPDVIVKEENYLNQIKDKYSVVAALDDKKEILEMFRKHGVNALHPVDLVINKSE